MSIIIESRQFDDTMIGWQFDQICASNMSNAHKLPVLVYIQVESSLFPLRYIYIRRNSTFRYSCEIDINCGFNTYLNKSIDEFELKYYLEDS